MSKILAVGDVHTKTWIIDSVEAVIDEYDGVVFVGDYVDNWGASAEDSINTWKRLYKLMQDYPKKVSAVRGNHDYIYSERTTSSQSGFNQITQHMINDAQNVKLKRWLENLPLIVEIDGVTYAHAGIDERWDGDQSVAGMWNDISPIWVRPDWAQYKKIPQVVGHTPQQTCTEVEPKIWVIDTFSQYPDGSPIGDGTMLVVTDGKQFTKINNANNSNTTDLSGGVS